jgi:hypothetical protein
MITKPKQSSSTSDHENPPIEILPDGVRAECVVDQYEFQDNTNNDACMLVKVNDTQKQQQAEEQGGKNGSSKENSPTVNNNCKYKEELGYLVA